MRALVVVLVVAYVWCVVCEGRYRYHHLASDDLPWPVTYLVAWLMCAALMPKIIYCGYYAEVKLVMAAGLIAILIFTLSNVEAIYGALRELADRWTVWQRRMG